jgi:hypothetical protein
MLAFEGRSTREDRALRKVTWQLRRPALAIPVLLMLAPCACAETVTETASKWGLIGAWSLDCALPPDHDRGAVLIYEVARGARLIYRRNFGGASDDNEVVGAKVTADGMLNLRVFFPSLKETREYGLMKQPDGSIRAMYNRSQKGKYTINHGEFTTNGNPTPPQYKCTSVVS